jgi:hypothetical protein
MQNYEEGVLYTAPHVILVASGKALDWDASTDPYVA